MDALKAQIASQKRKIAQEHNDGNKYMRRGDIEAITTQQYARELQERTPDLPESNEHIQATSQNMAESARDDVMTPNQDELVAQKTLDPSKDKIMCRLREKSEPICLFGESDEDRIQRLHALEQASEREIKGKGVFIENSKNEYEGGAGEKSVSQGQEKDTPSKDRVPARMREGVGMHTVMDLKLIWTDTPRVYPIIYYTLKGILEDWETELEQRPDIVKRSEKGQKMNRKPAEEVPYSEDVASSPAQNTMAQKWSSSAVLSQISRKGSFSFDPSNPSSRSSDGTSSDGHNTSSSYGSQKPLENQRELPGRRYAIAADNSQRYHSAPSFGLDPFSFTRSSWD
ncbi:unnamed protein product [Malassezia sympodialis ATCC 42132]|uniref:uncharacterized protein n=1 Tax=Malassezia sympodialis (strain ATCC 42132) TaxID=1230383 RepID=UPI0002C20F37|nr:uncharacterized protein MSY001_3147 [Malassezia sympodialis ATCC 42132]CCV00442.1 unnamed protein product [Malassezia sympodialis ATCC 42132]|eukprot:XP_018741638.1 uncharacterized protein MSY001_3147 [Malassezia sympodialis ATCC 42132]